MKMKIMGAALFALTLATVALYPSFGANSRDPSGSVGTHTQTPAPRVDVVFVLDTTGSMSGLIQTAKEKIWSIATTMTSAQQMPDIRIGLVAYRDRGDEYVTRVVNLSDDLDSVYATLMDFEAAGGGDGPESVNLALNDAVHSISWSQDPDTYQAIFLVGDAPPHMDYAGEVQYPEILAAAASRGIVVNTIQCGSLAGTHTPWQQIATLGKGRYFQVEQAGGALAMTTPYDADIARLSARLDDTRLYYGSHDEKRKMQRKVEATEKLNKHASLESRARRGAFNVSASGKKNRLGENELIDAVNSGRLELKDIPAEELPSALQALAPAEQAAVVEKMAKARSNLESQLRQVAEERDGYIARKIDDAGGARDSLDHKIFEAVREQAADAGLDYRDGPGY